MTVYRALVRISLRPSILDPEGKAIRQTMQGLGYEQVESVRMGKAIELTIRADGPEEAERVAREAAEKLLANPVMEDFHLEIEPA